MKQPQVIEKRRLVSPATTPQALAWDSRNKWLGWVRAICDESMRSIQKWNALETTRSARHSVGRRYTKRRTAFYHRRRRG